MTPPPGRGFPLGVWATEFGRWHPPLGRGTAGGRYWVHIWLVSGRICTHWRR